MTLPPRTIRTPHDKDHIHECRNCQQPISAGILIGETREHERITDIIIDHLWRYRAAQQATGNPNPRIGALTSVLHAIGLAGGGQQAPTQSGDMTRPERLP
jgi:hypothetical protein